MITKKTGMKQMLCKKHKHKISYMQQSIKLKTITKQHRSSQASSG